MRARTLEVIAERGIGDGDALRAGHPPRAPAQRDHAADAAARAPGRASRPPRRADAARPRRPDRPRADRDPRRRACRSAPPPTASPTTTSARATRVDARPPSASAAPPVTNATWLHFVEGGGYERREWWSDEGWSWKEEYDITHPLHWSDDGHEWRMGGWAPLDPDKPVVHVSWFEADAFARAHGARLPTEAEWERAATWDQRTQSVRAPSPRARQPRPDARFGTAAGRRLPGGRRARAARWACSATSGSGPRQRLRRLPRLRRPPVPRVLRGLLRRGLPASCAAARGRPRARVASPTFRNWDLPQRRQIFSGVRLAWDA